MNKTAIVFTSSRKPETDLFTEAREQGATLVWLPLIGTRPLSSETVKQRAWDLRECDVLLVTSENAIPALQELLGDAWGDFVKHCPLVLAVGDSTESALHMAGFHAEVPPGVTTAKDLGSYVGTHLTDKRVGVFQGSRARPELRQVLESANVRAEYVTVYETTPNVSASDDVQKCLSAFSRVIWTFFSPSGVDAWMTAHTGVTSRQDEHIAAIGMTTKQACIDRGMPVHVTAERPNARELLLTICRYINTL